MIYGYMISNKNTVSNIDTIIESEFESFKKINESYDLLVSNNLLTEDGNTLKSYWQVFITKIREIIRKLKTKIKEIFNNFIIKFRKKIFDEEFERVEKQLDGLNHNYIQQIQSVNLLVIKDCTRLDIFHDIVGKDISNYYSIGDTDEDVKTSKSGLESMFDAEDLNIDDIINEYFTEVSFMILPSKRMIDTLKANMKDVYTINEKNLNNANNILKGLETSLEKISKMDIDNNTDEANKRKLQNMKEIYTNYVEEVKISIKLIQNIFKAFRAVNSRNISTILIAAGIRKRGWSNDYHENI